MKSVYPAIFKPESVGGYSVNFPDLPGCITEGEDLNQALEMAQEVLGLFLATLEEQKKTVPSASSIEAIETSQDEFVNLVLVDINQYRRNKLVNTTVVIPAWLKEAGEREDVNFSRLLKEALKQKLGY